MKAYQNRLQSEGKIGFFEVDKPTLKSGQALVKILYAGLNRRDYKIRQGKYQWNYADNTTLGSDGCGIVIETFDKTDDHWIGKTIIINPNINWGAEQAVPSKHYSILGMPTNGTFAEYVAINVNQMVSKPIHLTESVAAALPLAALTAYRVTFVKAAITEKTKVLITGIGGGVAQMAAKFALSTGAIVYVTSGNNQKIERAKIWGVKNGQNYHDEDWGIKLKSETGLFDIVIDSAGGKAVHLLFDLLKQGGQYIFYGTTNGNPQNFPLSTIYYKQLQLIGSLMGSDLDFENMIRYISKYNIKPEVDTVLPFDHIETGFGMMKTQSQFGKIVLSM